VEALHVIALHTKAADACHLFTYEHIEIWIRTNFSQSLWWL